jgi:hypothetical protein
VWSDPHRAWRQVGLGETGDLMSDTEPVTKACPIGCLGLSEHARRPLVRAYGLDADERPRTVGDVLRLAQEGKLSAVGGIGRVRLAEIETALAAAGLECSHPEGHRHR